MQEERSMSGLDGNKHADQPVLEWGAPLAEARAALLLVHGRGSHAATMRSLFEDVTAPGVAGLAPQAALNTWYPHRFTAPLETNEPWLTWALDRLDQLVRQVEAAGIPREKIVLLGFSQGACLSLEYAARHASRFGGVIGLSGGLIGPEGTPRDYAGAFDGAPVFLGVADNDDHIPVSRVRESAAVFERMGAAVTARVYPGVGHTVVEDEVEFARALIQTLIEP